MQSGSEPFKRTRSKKINVYFERIRCFTLSATLAATSTDVPDADSRIFERSDSRTGDRRSIIKAPPGAAGPLAFLPADLFDRRRWSEPVSGFERQCSAVSVGIESRFRGSDATSGEERKLRAQSHR